MVFVGHGITMIGNGLSDRGPDISLCQISIGRGTLTTVVDDRHIPETESMHRYGNRGIHIHSRVAYRFAFGDPSTTTLMIGATTLRVALTLPCLYTFVSNTPPKSPVAFFAPNFLKELSFSCS